MLAALATAVAVFPAAFCCLPCLVMRPMTRLKMLTKMLQTETKIEMDVIVFEFRSLTVVRNLSAICGMF